MTCKLLKPIAVKITCIAPVIIINYIFTSFTEHGEITFEQRVMLIKYILLSQVSHKPWPRLIKYVPIDPLLHKDYKTGMKIVITTFLQSQYFYK